jgi:hypothetical protein
MLAALAAATIGMTYTPPIVTRPEDVDARGYALVFSREDRGTFSVLIKDAGKKWDQVPEVEETAEKECDFSWVVFHTIIPNMDFVLHSFKSQGAELDAKADVSADLSDYFEEDGITADNNFGLHDIY